MFRSCPRSFTLGCPAQILSVNLIMTYNPVHLQLVTAKNKTTIIYMQFKLSKCMNELSFSSKPSYLQSVYKDEPESMMSCHCEEFYSNQSWATSGARKLDKFCKDPGLGLTCRHAGLCHS